MPSDLTVEDVFYLRGSVTSTLTNRNEVISIFLDFFENVFHLRALITKVIRNVYTMYGKILVVLTLSNRYAIHSIRNVKRIIVNYVRATVANFGQ